MTETSSFLLKYYFNLESRRLLQTTLTSVISVQ